MSFLLDTNICSTFLKYPRRLSHRFIQHGGRLNIASLTLGELYTWAYRRPDPESGRNAILRDLLPQVAVLFFEHECAVEYGKTRAHLLNMGRPMDSIDLAIAATALAHNLTLVTHNTQDFLHVPGLRLDDWLKS
jgi:tRNA(fMet)-specific endonuclease VapC